MQISDELGEKLKYFLARVGDGYIELSQDKVRGEYHYFKKKAQELKWELHDELSKISEDDASALVSRVAK